MYLGGEINKRWYVCNVLGFVWLCVAGEDRWPVSAPLAEGAQP